MAAGSKKKTGTKRIIIIGASSGIGRELALKYLSQSSSNILGITGRRTEKLEEVKALYPKQVFYRTMDVQKEGCVEVFDELIEEMGGMDVMIYCAGVGTQNPHLESQIEMPAVRTNVYGFTLIIIRAYNYFREQGSGHVVTIASIAGIRPLRQSPAYSATKRYQIHYTSCLASLAHYQKLRIKFTTITPGFIKTGLLKHEYPFVISLDKGSRLIFKAIEKKKRNASVPGRWRFVKFIWRLVPFWEKWEGAITSYRQGHKRVLPEDRQADGRK